ncbi:MAG: acyl-CoA thioesterase [Nitriliruptoraceae bacterium]
MPITTSIDVRFYELDPYGHVNHAVYLNYFEVARIELLDRIGWGLSRLQALGYHLVVVEAALSFRAPAVAGDRLTVHSQLGELKRATAVWHQRIVREADDRMIADNRVRSTVTDLSGRPCAAPAELLEALRPLQPSQVA